MISFYVNRVVKCELLSSCKFHVAAFQTNWLTWSSQWGRNPALQLWGRARRMGNTWGSSGSIPISGGLEGPHSAARLWRKMTKCHFAVTLNHIMQSHKIDGQKCMQTLLVRNGSRVHTVISLSLQAAHPFCLRTWNTSTRNVSRWPWAAWSAAASTISAEHTQKTMRC